MIVTIASGKGGTGKTTLSASLAAIWERPLVAVDLDVEEPNLHLFLKPRLASTESVHLEVPVLDETRCTLCRACVELCQFKALAIFGKTLMVMPDMCHGCGGCFEVCPSEALLRGSRELGVMEIGQRRRGGAWPEPSVGSTRGTQSEQRERAVPFVQDERGSIPCLTGRLRIGEAMSPPLMRHIRQRMLEMAADMGADILIDAPPGVSCPAMNAVQDSDVILLVTEPTPFGFHDFQLAWEAFAPLRKPMGVVVNRAGLGDDRVYSFCEAKGLPVLAEIPYRREIAEHYAKGGLLAEMDADVVSGPEPDTTWGARGERRASSASGRSPSFMAEMRWCFARIQEGLDALHQETAHA